MDEQRLYPGVASWDLDLDCVTPDDAPSAVVTFRRWRCKAHDKLVARVDFPGLPNGTISLDPDRGVVVHDDETICYQPPGLEL